METKYPMPFEARNDSTSEVLPLLNNESEDRPYQAYCVTEASSMPPSPDTLTPRPLRIQPLFAQERCIEPHSTPGNSIAQSPATRTELDKDLAILPRRENQSIEQGLANRRPQPRCPMLVKVNHITQAVTPRGCHSLAGSQTLVYNRTPSHLRLQQTTPAYATTSQAYRRKPLPQQVSDAGMDHHPLPPLPVEVSAEKEFDDLECPSRDPPIVDEEVLRQALQQGQISPQHDYDFSNRRSLPLVHCSIKELSIPPTTVPGIELNPEVFARSVTFEDNLVLSTLRVPNDDVFTRDSSTSTRQGRIIDEYAKFPSSAELYIPRGLLSDMNDHQRAHRRTQPKGAKLKYQFGRRPSAQLDISPPTPLHRQLPNLSQQASSSDTSLQQLTPDYFSLPLSSPSFHSSTESQAGPRPPPWGSYDNLEMQRRSRGDAREREEARKYRTTVDNGYSISLRKGSGSIDSFADNPVRREVEEYKEQLLRLYPDMEFDGTAGKVGRKCWGFGCEIM